MRENLGLPFLGGCWAMSQINGVISRTWPVMGSFCMNPPAFPPYLIYMHLQAFQGGWFLDAWVSSLALNMWFQASQSPCSLVTLRRWPWETNEIALCLTNSKWSINGSFLPCYSAILQSWSQDKTWLDVLGIIYITTHWTLVYQSV